MRVVIVSTEFPPGPGGIGTHAFEVARHLEALGHAVIVVTSQDYAPADEVASFNRAQRFRIVRLAYQGSVWRKAWGRLTRILDVIEEARPDVLLATGQRAAWLTAMAAAKKRVPWLAVGHGTEFASRKALDRIISRAAYTRADGVVCVSRFTDREMRQLGIRPKRAWLVHNGADPERFRRLPPAEVEAYVASIGLKGKRLIVTVGRVCERKGQQVVIRALPGVLARVPDVHYVVAGLPEQREAFEALARAEGVLDHVHFLGRTAPEDVVRLLNACELFVMTSTRTRDGDIEGFGIAVIEAALCGVPAVVSRGSGLTEAIVEGQTGVSVPEGDVNATAEALVSLLTDDAARRRMGLAAQQRAGASHTWSHVAKRFEESLGEIAGGKPARSVAPSVV